MDIAEVMHAPFQLRLPRLPRINLTLRSTIAVMLCCAMLCVTQGCTTEQTKTVVQDVANAIPTIQASVDTAAQVVVLLNPMWSPAINTIVDTANAGLVQLRALCQSYANSPSPTVLGSINDMLNSLLNQSASALLDAAKIADAVSRATAIRVLSAIQIALQLAYALFQKIQSKAQVATTAAMRTYKLTDIASLLDSKANRVQVTQATGVPYTVAMNYELARGF